MADRTFLTWPFFDDAHRAHAAALDAWSDTAESRWTAQSHGSHINVDDVCRSLVRELGAGEWLRHAVPAPHGGARPSLDVRTLCLTRETLARHDGLADFAFAMQGLGAGPISLF